MNVSQENNSMLLTTANNNGEVRNFGLNEDGSRRTKYCDGSILPPPKLVLPDAALYGKVGSIVKRLTKGTEADPAGVLIHLLARFGNEVGPNVYFPRGCDKHPVRLFSVFVGDSNNGAKGVSSGLVEHIFKDLQFDERPNTARGLSSGQGLIQAVCDASTGRNEKGQRVQYDAVDEKRLFVYEKEFGKVLSQMLMPSNILPGVLNNAWDGDPLGDMTKNNALKATGAHIGLIGHITQEELHEKLRSQRYLLHNGFGNRILWLHTEARAIVPNPPILPDEDVAEIRQYIEECVRKARLLDVVNFHPAADKFYDGLYRRTKVDLLQRSGIFKSVSTRAMPQLCRLALGYALLEQASEIKVEHLIAANAFWGYSDQSAAMFFGTPSGSGKEQLLLDALASGRKSKTEVNDLFGKGNTSSTEIDNIVNPMLHTNKIITFKEGRTTYYELARKHQTAS